MKQLPALLLIVSIFISACSLLGGDEDPQVTAESPQVPTPANTPALQSTPATPVAASPVTRSITLTMWTAPEIAPDREVVGGSTLAEQLAAFDAAHPDVNLFVELKTTSEQGGSLSYLRTGRSIAPRILPDIVFLPASQLPVAASQGLIYPIETLLDEAVTEDLFPAAEELVRIDDHIYGYPFALTELQHLVYNSNLITETVSSDWQELLAEQPGRFLFPAAGTAGAELTLQFYRANGGTLLNDANQPALQIEPLTVALEEIRRGVSAGLIDSQSGGAATVEQTWQIFGSNPGYIVQTSATHFLQQEGAEPRPAYQALPLPGQAGSAPPIVGAMTWAISTPDPTRQALAAELIRWLGSTQNIGEWTFQSRQLPARRSGFEAWPAGGYVEFLQEQLELARPSPPGSNNSLMQALSHATTNVILDLSSPEEAAAEAAAAVQP